jgi:hypothetical protein
VHEPDCLQWQYEPKYPNRFTTSAARFFLVKHTKTGKIYQMTTKFTQWPQNISMAIKYSNVYTSTDFEKLPPYVYSDGIRSHDP